jgi:hypothetical protein
MIRQEFKRHLENLRASERELEEYVERHPSVIAYINALSPEEVALLLFSIPHHIGIKLLNLMDPALACKVLRSQYLAHDRAMYLANIRESQRLYIVEQFTMHRNSEMLEEVQHWQEIEMRDPQNRILESIVMTGEELPDHYPHTMSRCVSCGKGYRKWQSVWAADCEIHSYHEEGCNVGKCGACPLGDKCPT